MSKAILAKPNHKKYDHVFRIVFNNREELLSLYNALADTSYTDPNMLEINTLEDAVFLGMKNDVSFIIDNYLNLYEHQSTLCPNMPLRGLFYLADLLKTMYFEKTIYNSSQIKILTPKFIVFYNGIANVEDNFDLRLSDSFINKVSKPDLELIAHVININYGHNRRLASKCQKLKEYSIFVDRVHKALRDILQAYHSEKLAEVIDSCIKDHVLEDILCKERSRIMASTLSHFDFDEYIEFNKKEFFEQGYDKGYKARQAEIDVKDAEISKLKSLLISNNINPDT